MNQLLSETIYDKYSIECGNILTTKLRQKHYDFKTEDQLTTYGYFHQDTEKPLWKDIDYKHIRKYHREQSRLTSNAVKYISLLNFKRKSIIPSNELFYILYKIVTVFSYERVNSNPCITVQEKNFIFKIIEKSPILSVLFECVSGYLNSSKIKMYNVIAEYFNKHYNNLYQYANCIIQGGGDKKITLMDIDVKSLCLFYNKQIMHIHKKNYELISDSYTIYSDSMYFVNS